MKWLKVNINGRMVEDIKDHLKHRKCMDMENFGFLIIDII
jgi:hypothetical protein